MLSKLLSRDYKSEILSPQSSHNKTLFSIYNILPTLALSHEGTPRWMISVESQYHPDNIFAFGFHTFHQGYKVIRNIGLPIAEGEVEVQ